MEQLGVCPVCKGPLYEGQKTQPLPPSGIATRSKKSGLLYSSSEDTNPWAIVHLTCAPSYFNWKTHREMYDEQYDQIKEQVYIEKREELQRDAETRAEEAVLEELDALRTGKICMECRAEITETHLASLTDS